MFPVWSPDEDGFSGFLYILASLYVNHYVSAFSPYTPRAILDTQLPVFQYQGPIYVY